MAKYDFFIAGRWRNKDNIQPLLDVVRASGKTAYCFIENAYEGEPLSFNVNSQEDIEATMQDIRSYVARRPHDTQNLRERHYGRTRRRQPFACTPCGDCWS